MQIRPLSSISRSIYEEHRPFYCDAQDEPEVPCEEKVIGHLWPSDYSFLRWIKTVRAAREQTFPTLNGTMVCEKHYQLLKKALDVYDSDKVDHGYSFKV